MDHDVGKAFVASEDVAAARSPRCVCHSCRRGRGENVPLKTKRVDGYSSTPPGGWMLRKLRSERAPGYFIGVELETDNFRPSTVGRDSNRFGTTITDSFDSWGRRTLPVRGTPIHIRSFVDNSTAAGMERPEGFWHTKVDGSVTGPEFASHPGSFKYWRSIKTEVKEMLRLLSHAGYRSHANDKCGMHVSISKTAFEVYDPALGRTRLVKAHLTRFLTMIYGDPDWSFKMSQRSRGSMRWAKLHNAYGGLVDPAGVAASIIMTGRVGDRYVALNAPSDGKRFEFRLPRGTLRLDRFYKNIEWAVAMVEFTRPYRRVEDVTPATFMAWARERRSEYPNLVKFLDEKFPVVTESTERVVA